MGCHKVSAKYWIVIYILDLDKGIQYGFFWKIYYECGLYIIFLKSLVLRLGPWL